MLMKQILLVAALGYSLITVGQGSYLRKNAGAEWPTLRGNNNRDGRVVSTGEFKNAATLSQSIDFSTTEAYVELFPSSKNSSVSFKKDEIGKPDQLHSVTTDWQTELTTEDQTENGAYLDLLGDGKSTLVPLMQNVKYARLFQGDKKYYRIEAYDGFGSTSNVNSDIFVGIRIYEGNSKKMILEKKFRKDQFMQRPHITVADMNNDNEKDIIITSWEGIYVFNNKGDSIAGLSQMTKGWHRLRKRGFACVKDIDGNGYNDVVIISSLPWHVDVIKNDKGVLKFGWTRIFDGLVESAKKISKPILNSVSDFDGDGSYEILVNVYNYNDDNNWSGVLFDATNGTVKGQILGAYVVSATDVNANGKYFFFCTETQGQSVPLAAPLKVMTFENGNLREILRIKNGEWINPRIPNILPNLTTHNDGISSLAEDAVLCADYEQTGRKAFFAKTKNPDESSVIRGYYLSEKGNIEKTDLSVTVPAGMYGELLRERTNRDGTHSLLLQVKAFGAPSGVINITRGIAKNLGRYTSPSVKNFIPVIADLNNDGQPEILIPNDVGELLCFGKNAKGSINVTWKVPGHGMMWQYSPSLEYGVAVDDLNHDGYKETIVNGSNEVGAVLSVYDHKGKILWRRSFPEIHSGEITGWDGNLAFYGTAQSTKRSERDVVVTVQRGIAHGGKTYCLSGKDGSIVWELDRLTADMGDGRIVDSGAGGYVFSTYDIDADGADEVMCGFGNVVFFADVNDGALKFKAFMRKVFLDHYDYPGNGYTSFWMQQIVPVAFHNGAKLELACFNTMVAAGTMDTNGVLTWCPKQLDYGDRYWQCMTNVDGDGKLWVVELSNRLADNVGVLFAYDPVNGKPHKSFSLEMPGFHATLRSGTMPVACDMNGDGKDEIVISNNTGVYCVGLENGKAVVLWKYLAKDCGPVVVADVDADGFVEVVTATQNGKILILDK
jgi:hypothetical protein